MSKGEHPRPRGKILRGMVGDIGYFYHGDKKTIGKNNEIWIRFIHC